MSTGADRTAFGPMVIVAADQHEARPLIEDPLARRLLPAGGRFAVALTRYRPIRRAMIAATEKKIPGLWASMLCRKRYVDDVLRAALDDGGIEAVVILGAGFDTRACRLHALAKIPVYEVDLPVNIDRKRAALTKALGRVPANVTLVPVDFETQSLADTLARHGYPARRTFFIWEAVTQYLTEGGVRRTFDFLATAAAGSHLVFTYVRKDFLDGTALYGAEAAYGEFVEKRQLWRFGMAPDRVGAFLAEYGWHEREQAGPEEFATRYLRPAGRDLPVSEIERSVSATR
ncbi:SAM-dependent methyltransferase [Amycolatopsis dendrobii]|uniref:S-adenosyl-L-methionine-dependent methyltransferase n=1 Tax=Amycolatopsis dendrobii TaxID=2760662 RepID=A0A7W3ZDH2_9PSEU|nr:SAM-dependent methyltransferase [Amycolatopsis dendrobii]MBB1156943.1 SAM-dependent methyltransferase [Amycolatopsis dendrobii]